MLKEREKAVIYKLLPTRVYRSYYGGKNIDLITGAENPQVTRYPEDWLASVTEAFNPGHYTENEGLSVTEDGRFLRDIINSDKENMIGKRESMSLLFKLLDADERLAVQVHPTVEFAKKYFNSEYGKTECWYVLNDGGYVYIGFKPGITKEYMQDIFQKQDIDKLLECMHRFDVKKGDFIFVNGGVPHAIGAGCFIAELQEPTDLMVVPERVTPSGVVLAEEKLHGGLGFEKMFDVFVYDGKDREETYDRYFITPKIVNGNEKILADSDITDKYRLSEFKTKNRYTLNSDSYAIAVVIEGKGSIGETEVKTGDRIFIPENEKCIEIEGDMTILVCRP